MSDEAATSRVCAAYNANRTLGAGTTCRPQGDEIVFVDPRAPDPRYPVISVDVIISNGGFWSAAVAACK